MDTASYFKSDYSGFKAEDLLKDEAFIEWVRSGSNNSNLEEYWGIIIRNNPALVSEAEKAARIIRAVASENEAENNRGYEESWDRINSRRSVTKFRSTLNIIRHYALQSRAVAAVAGTILLVAAAFWGGYILSRDKLPLTLQNNQTIVYSPAGQRTEIILPDSSKVWLNAKTTLIYSSGFNVDNRNIYLDGEAYFSVAKGSVPFIVKTEAINIKVLGTEFNVKCYKEETRVEATLVSGSMEIERTSAESGIPETILLKPNQKIVFSRVTREAVRDKATLDERTIAREIHIAAPPVLPVEKIDLIEVYDTRKSTSWVNGLLLVEAETLLELSLKLERRYDVKIVFMSDDLKEFRYTGTLREYSLEQVLDVIAATSPVKYRIDEQVVYIGKNDESITNYMRVTTDKK